MSNLNRKTILIAIITIFAIVMTVVLIIRIFPNKTTSPPNKIEAGDQFTVTFSHKAGFYNETFDLQLYAPEGADIYYTLDGSVPTTSSAKYTEPINAEALGRGEVNILSVRAIAVNENETSEIVTQSFVKGKGVFNRFGDDVLIFSLTSDPHGLYDHHDGILVEGIDREEWRRENTGSPNPLDPANYNRRGRESEREVYVEMFDNLGQLYISQNAGMRVKGGYSREISQKSLELYARKEYGDSNTFLFAFFGENADDGNLINRYRRIRLRNGGNDRDFATVRDELGQELFKQAGHPDYQMHTPAAVFLNGEYYGFAWIKTPRTENHWARKYGGNSDNFRHIGNNEKGPNGEEDAVADWAEVYELAEGGLSDDKRFEEFCNRVDIDNFIRYYAIQVYINNKDWPHGNIEMWRYYPEMTDKDGDIENNEYLDGKWRFIPQDIEFSWNLYGNSPPSENTLSNVLTGKGHMGGNSVLLEQVLARDDMKLKFANTLVDLIEGAFAPDNVKEILNSLLRRNWSEVKVAINSNILQPDNPDWPSTGSMKDSQDMIRSFAERRPNVMLEAINTTLDLDKDSRYTVSLTTSAGGGAVMNSRPVAEDETVIGNYYTDSTIIITARPYSGYVVDYWTVGGDKKQGNSVSVEGESTVELHFKKSPDATLHISKVKTGEFDNDGYIEIRNDTGGIISTKGLYISDSGSNLLKWEMPDISINTDEAILISTKNSNLDTAAAQTNFNLKPGKKIRLSDEEGNVLSMVEVSFMRRFEVQLRMRDGNFKVVYE